MALGKVSTRLLARYKWGKRQTILHVSCNNLIINSRALNESFMQSPEASICKSIFMTVIQASVRHRRSCVFRQNTKLLGKEGTWVKQKNYRWFSHGSLLEALSTGTLEGQASCPELSFALADRTFMGCSTQTRDTFWITLCGIHTLRPELAQLVVLSQLKAFC